MTMRLAEAQVRLSLLPDRNGAFEREISIREVLLLPLALCLAVFD